MQAARHLCASSTRNTAALDSANTIRAGPSSRSPFNLLFLLDGHKPGAAGRATDDAATDPLKMVLFTLEHMARGGIRDHLGGGYHRYSTDRYWRVPHFEKMLYDNAQLASVYLIAYEITGDPRCARKRRRSSALSPPSSRRPMGLSTRRSTRKLGARKAPTTFGRATRFKQCSGLDLILIFFARSTAWAASRPSRAGDLCSTNPGRSRRRPKLDR